MKRYLFIASAALLMGTITQVASAQTDSCIIKLKNAGTGFDQGEYDVCFGVLFERVLGIACVIQIGVFCQVGARRTLRIRCGRKNQNPVRRQR